jgi:hypothetical protein
MDLEKRYFALLQSIRQVGRAQIGRVLGTVGSTRGNYKAWMDLLERSYFVRAEVNAVCKLLIDKGIMTHDEWRQRIVDELESYLKNLSAQWPELEFSEIGMTVKDPKAFAKRMAEERWPE